MAPRTICDHCQQPCPLNVERCPHCGRPGLFPNVRLAAQPEELAALEQRYRGAVADAAARGAAGAIGVFEAAVAGSMAVIHRSWRETDRLADTDDELYATYYEQAEAPLRVPKGEKWDALRRALDHTMFQGYEKQVRFAALSLDGLGLTSYGECGWVLREPMIAHRAAVFQDNPSRFLRNHDFLKIDDGQLPLGYRASWPMRARLCVAKLAGRLEAGTTQAEHAALLLRRGATFEDDDYVEVHIGGPMTIRTIERVVVSKQDRRRAIAKALKQKLERFGVEIEGKAWTP